LTTALAPFQRGLRAWRRARPTNRLPWPVRSRGAAACRTVWKSG